MTMVEWMDWTRIGWFALPCLTALVVSGRVAWHLARRILAEGPHLPQWLEAVSPLKGRWLRLFLSAPALLFLILSVFFGTAASLLLLEILFFILFGVHGVVGLLAVAGLCLYFYWAQQAEAEWMARRRSPEGSR